MAEDLPFLPTLKETFFALQNVEVHRHPTIVKQSCFAFVVPGTTKIFVSDSFFSLNPIQQKIVIRHESDHLLQYTRGYRPAVSPWKLDQMALSKRPPENSLSWLSTNLNKSETDYLFSLFEFEVHLRDWLCVQSLVLQNTKESILKDGFKTACWQFPAERLSLIREFDRLYCGNQLLQFIVRTWIP